MDFLFLKDALKVPKEYVVLVAGALLLILVFFGMGAGSLCNVVGFVYPAFKSFQAIESKVRGDDTQWLIYWVVYAFFSIIEVFVDFLLYWIPFYYAFKLAFLLWAMLPQTVREVLKRLRGYFWFSSDIYMISFLLIMIGFFY